jgi:hypothetical protein
MNVFGGETWVKKSAYEKALNLTKKYRLISLSKCVIERNISKDEQFLYILNQYSMSMIFNLGFFDEIDTIIYIYNLITHINLK